ncbi:major facilitator superfamily domain-containing protein 1-like [Uranotaenia lowii]|uniref:major facilitator superfamily domain-containing protein 1-like n=1 Tax=Uranotaenia lowii TaxID=190385 RepID=UPI00247AB693|nr:major facilitator superfamily domain-containing protein 1-like [Uranotaenia lowii]XP_055593268.1 major facilitator superfamily domain-containing protein 1-like [Uranotaenia lowii]XP_055593287.1 major facilitator superfamily domain-containing protein 1-like [Uranotaenia lowii]XP_055593288.1 major facilitator superfamily domain-containing protein 1-like [Uranotaenia lowii]
MPRLFEDDEVRRPILQDTDSEDPPGDSRERISRQSDDDELNQRSAGCGSSACCNPKSSLHRFIALILMCLVGFGSYFCYDNPGALQDKFKSDLDLSTTQFVWLYSIYSWPNVILCFIGGFLIDRVFGIRLGTIIYMFILLIGQLIFATGGLLKSFWLMILGRFLFGIGAESLAVAQNNYAVLWFKGKELNMVFGLQLSFARVGSTVNFLVMVPVYNYVSSLGYKGALCTGAVLLLATLTCVMSMMCALVLGWMDKRAARILRRNDNPPNGEVAKLSDIGTFKISFWMVTVICVAYYVAIFPFIALGKVFFMRKFDFTPEDANTVNSIVYIVAGVASPLFGLIVDRTGRNVLWVFISIVVTIFAHGLLAFSFYNPYIAMITMGMAYSMLASSLWPLVALIVPEYQLGTAYGICQSVQNLGLAVISMISGLIVDKGGYFMLEIFFIGWLVVSLLATIVIWLYDANNDGLLNMSTKDRLAQTYKNLSDSANNEPSIQPVAPDGSLNSDTDHEHQQQPPQQQLAGQQPEVIRNRYLNRVLDNRSDSEPLIE